MSRMRVKHRPAPIPHLPQTFENFAAMLQEQLVTGQVAMATLSLTEAQRQQWLAALNDLETILPRMRHMIEATAALQGQLQQTSEPQVQAYIVKNAARLIINRRS